MRAICLLSEGCIGLIVTFSTQAKLRYLPVGNLYEINLLKKIVRAVELLPEEHVKSYICNC